MDVIAQELDQLELETRGQQDSVNRGLLPPQGELLSVLKPEDVSIASSPNGSGYDMTDSLDEAPIDLRTLVYVSIPEHLNCPICQLPFINPYTTICGHTFCRTCILETFKSPLGNKCPLDRIELNYTEDRQEAEEKNYNDIFPAPIILSNITDDLQVRCLNASRGCKWVGPRWSIKQHLVNSCDHTRFPCEHELDNGQVCGQLTERRFLGEKCPHKLFECAKCGDNINAVAEEHHLKNECAKNFHKCNGCNLEFPEKTFENHESYCEKIHVRCPGKQYGCEWRGSREVLTQIHSLECVFVKLSGYFELQETKINDLADENKLLRSQISTILDSITQGKMTNLGYSLQLEEIMDRDRSADPGRLFDSLQDKDYVQLMMEFEMLRTEFNRLRSLASEFELHKQLVTAVANENIQIKDELHNQTAALSSMRQQIQFMLLDRRRLRSKLVDAEVTPPPKESSSSGRFTNKL
ncbi:hypothetical protein KL910_003792 [Ogataea haglerorum]|nr:hypothetical protein KL910_003792 [Ogataea haglerorum]KAG7788835.1 hypothetical protein KL945_002274 [Ogataea haglerorum]